MWTRNKLAVATLTAATMLGSAATLPAATIQFQTISNLVNLGGGVSVSFVGTTSSIYTTTSAPGTFDPIDFGTFSVTGGSINLSAPVVDNITIDTILPVADGGETIHGNISGEFVNYGPVNADTIEYVVTSGSIVINYALPNGVGTPPEITQLTYNFLPTNIGTTGLAPYTAPLMGSIAYIPASGSGPTPTPLPASVFGGSALLGGIFLAKSLKRKNVI